MTETNLRTYDTFVPGTDLGSFTETIDAAALQRWATLYPWDVPPDGQAPIGMLTVLMMRAYMNVLTRRPPGGIHASQLQQVLRAPRANETVTTAIHCAGKEIRRERRYIDLQFKMTDASGQLLAQGRMDSIWAA